MSHILDITRLVSRAHLKFDTGIDRVERAFVLDSLERFDPSLFLARVGRNFVILDVDGMRSFLMHESKNVWKQPTGLDRVRYKLPLLKRSVRTTLRSLGQRYSGLHALCDGLKKMNLRAFDYTNVGHTNLDALFLASLRKAGCVQMSAFVHDVIPLDFPELCRPDTVPRFQRNIESIGKYCDRIYCNSHYTSERLMHHLDDSDRGREIRVSYLGGLEPPKQHAHTARVNSRPSFVFLGTIEPRKNLGFLLDVWAELTKRIDATKMPNLLIIGKRGWEDSATFSRLDDAVANGYAYEFNDFDDAQVQAHLMGCQAMVFPSKVEGYGLPIQEALALELPVIASDIPVFRELYQGMATLLPLDDMQTWATFLLDCASQYECSNILYKNDNFSHNTITWDGFFNVIYSKMGASD